MKHDALPIPFIVNIAVACDVAMQKIDVSQLDGRF